MNIDFLGRFGFAWIIAYWAAIAAVHLFFALGVLSDAIRLRKLHERETVFVSGGFWAAATLLGGIGLLVFIGSFTILLSVQSNFVILEAMFQYFLTAMPNQALQRMPHACHVSCLGRRRATHESSLSLRSLGI